MHEEIGAIAGAIWHAFKGEVSLAQLKKKVHGKTPLFDWAIGWTVHSEAIHFD